MIPSSPPVLAYVYVEDATAAYTLLVKRLAQCPDLRGEAFHCSNESPVTVTDVVKETLALMRSSREPDIRDEASNEIREPHLSTAKAREMLGWAPSFSRDEGLQRTIERYEAFFGVERRRHAVVI